MRSSEIFRNQLLSALGLLVVFLLISFLQMAFAADQVQSTNSLIYSANATVSSTVNAPFTLYIGDNLAGVTSPVKTFTVTLGGVYTGSGTFAFTIDSDSTTLQTFTLPNVSSTPTPFQFTYVDYAHKVNPASSGSYSYTLNMVPSGVTLYGLSAVAGETHRFVPASCPDGSTDKVKTNEFLTASSDTAISSATTTAFSVYIGDNLASITNPVKSLYFVLSGVYTGGGTLATMLSGNGATAQTFTLPSVSGPTPFEFMYDDPTNSINPASGGTYAYSLTTTPSSVTLYDYGVTLVEEHRYSPPSCSGMPPKGEVYSGVFDTTGATPGPTYNAILWKGVLGGVGANQGHVRFQLAASDCSNGASNYPTCSVGTWSFIGGGTCSSADWFDPGASDTPYDLQSSSCIAQWNNKRYFRYGVEICSDDCTAAGSVTPRVDDVIVNWAP